MNETGIPRERPPRVEPGPGQESAWDYPRPPSVEPVRRILRVEFGGLSVAETIAGLRVVETASPPTYYFPPSDVATEFLEPCRLATICEWKGLASHWTIRVGDHAAEEAAWSYPDPRPGYEGIRGYLAFYARKVDVCTVGSEKVVPQEGSFYGGWITSDVVGPFKGGPGTEAW